MPKSFVIQCANCGCKALSDKPLKDWVCETCCASEACGGKKWDGKDKVKDKGLKAGIQLIFRLSPIKENREVSA